MKTVKAHPRSVLLDKYLPGVGCGNSCGADGCGVGVAPACGDACCGVAGASCGGIAGTTMSYVGAGGDYIATTTYQYVGQGAGTFTVVPIPAAGCSVWWLCCLWWLALLPFLFLAGTTTTTTTTPPIIISTPPPETPPPIVNPTPAPPGPGPAKHCKIFGDPHVITFDGQSASFYSQGEYWTVKSTTVWIQGRYMPTPVTNGLSVMKEVAIGGPFLESKDGTKNILRISSLSATFNDVPIIAGFPDAWENQDPMIKVVSDGNGQVMQSSRYGKQLRVVHVDLPLGVHLEINRWNEPGEGDYINTMITMSKQPNQDGHCGNYNGVTEDDTRPQIRARIGTTGVPQEELLFHTKTPVTPANRPDITNMPIDKTERAEELCTGKSKTGIPNKDCMIDVCFGGEHFADMTDYAVKDSERQNMDETEAEDEDEPGLLTRVFGAKPTEDSGFLTRVLGPSPTEDSGLYTRVLGPGPTKGAGLVTRVLGPKPREGAGLLTRILGPEHALTRAPGSPGAVPDGAPGPWEFGFGGGSPSGVGSKVAVPGTDPQLHGWPPQGVPGTDPQLPLSQGPLRDTTVQELSDVRREMDRLRAEASAPVQAPTAVLRPSAPLTVHVMEAGSRWMMGSFDTRWQPIRPLQISQETKDSPLPISSSSSFSLPPQRQLQKQDTAFEKVQLQLDFHMGQIEKLQQ
ncbi:unnamed protein product [Prorocentrum cordatum]|uniref:VWFD domain-containing protein n=1 Tax=Prorocentrum cordatum TaxID=2364126 RepID=A0ABN9V9P4_9DINO|nr:unnamed protein product [Polarella glacialis]